MTSFPEFLKNYDSEQLQVHAPQLYRIYKNLIREIQHGMSMLYQAGFNTAALALIGDLHPSSLMRYKIGKDIIFQQKNYYSDLLDKLLLLFPTIQGSFPKHMKVNDFYKRTFVPMIDSVNSQTEINMYYHTLGQLLAFVLLLRGIDMNVENIIISEGRPILFDFECIFSGKNLQPDNYSIDSTGMVQTAIEFDVSAITGGMTPVQSYLKAVLSGTSKKPTIDWKVPSKGHYYNKPNFKGNVANPLQYKSDILSGFREMKRLILEKLPEIVHLVSSTETGVRTIVSPTRFYRMILQSYAFPQVYTKIAPEDYIKNELTKRTLMYELVENKNLLEYEIECLTTWLIPKYVSEIHGTEILTGDNIVVANYKEPQFKTWIDYTKQLNQSFDNAEKRFQEIYP